MPRRSVHTVRDRDGVGWVNKVDGEEVSRHRLKERAVDAGREIARDIEAEHVIHNRDGKIAESNSYGPDPNPPKDQR